MKLLTWLPPWAFGILTNFRAKQPKDASGTCLTAQGIWFSLDMGGKSSRRRWFVSRLPPGEEARAADGLTGAARALGPAGVDGPSD